MLEIALIKRDVSAHQDTLEINAKIVSLWNIELYFLENHDFVYYISNSYQIFIQFIIGACSPSPCYNGGTCTIDTDGAPICDCPAGYYGDFCEQSNLKYTYA